VETPTDVAPRRSATRARLRYVEEGAPGLVRRRCGRAFRYVDGAGRAVRDPATLQRIRSLAIPPAWTDVWISNDPRGHLQATGRDARGRKQYRYHAEFRAVRDAVKFDVMIAVGSALPRLRAAVERHLGERALSRRRVLAAIVRMLDLTGMRIGNEEYARENGSFGLTTLRKRHARFSSRGVLLSFRGKSGVHRTVKVDDPRVVRLLHRCHGLPCETLFSWVDDDGLHHRVRSSDVNAYLRTASGVAMTAKCLRTWVATVRMTEELLRAGVDAPLKEPLSRVAAELGHTPTICKGSYIHPAILDHHQRRELKGALGNVDAESGREVVEAAVLAMLEGRPACETRRAA
jgi:DNA topoisomerase-1